MFALMRLARARLRRARSFGGTEYGESRRSRSQQRSEARRAAARGSRRKSVTKLAASGRWRARAAQPAQLVARMSSNQLPRRCGNPARHALRNWPGGTATKSLNSPIMCA